MKKNNDKKDEIYETKWEIFLRNYHNVPSFKALVKLLIYVVLFLGFVGVITIGNLGRSNNKKVDSTQTTTSVIKKYKDILVDFKTRDTKIELTFKQNGNIAKISAVNKDNVIKGTIKNNEYMKEFIIKDNQTYEVLIDDEIINDNIFGNIEKNFLVPNSLVDLLINNSATKRIKDNKILYNYSIDYNSIKYDIEVILSNEVINSINIKNDNEEYNILYE